MKKGILLIPILGIMFACSGGGKQSAESVDSLQIQTQAIEQSIQELNETIQNSDSILENTQDEIETILNEI